MEQRAGLCIHECSARLIFFQFESDNGNTSVVLAPSPKAPVPCIKMNQKSQLN